MGTPAARVERRASILEIYLYPGFTYDDLNAVRVPAIPYRLDGYPR